MFNTPPCINRLPEWLVNRISIQGLSTTFTLLSEEAITVSRTDSANGTVLTNYVNILTGALGHTKQQLGTETQVGLVLDTTQISLYTDAS